MVDGRRKSRSFRRSQVRTPSGRVVTHYNRRAPGKAQCAHCGDYLKGVARVSGNQLYEVAKTKKRPERPYGGVLCSKCARQTIVSKFRNIFSLSSK